MMSIIRKMKASILLFLPISLLAFSLAACEQEGPAEEVGENIDEAVEETQEEAEELGDKIEEK